MKNKTIDLNGSYSLDISTSKDVGFVNAYSFVAQPEWAVKIDNGPRFATRYTFSTNYAKAHKLFFECVTAKGAIQQAVIHATGGLKLGELWIKTIPIESDL